MESTGTLSALQPRWSDTGYMLSVDGKTWALGLDAACQTIAGAHTHWQERLRGLDVDLAACRERLEADGGSLAELSAASAAKRGKIERELQFLEGVRATTEETITILGAHLGSSAASA
jgi:hypothetical protein